MLPWPLMAFLRSRVIRSTSAPPKINFLGETVEINDNFRLYLLTVHRDVDFPPEVVANVTLLDFAMTDQGLQQHLLSTVVAEQRPDLKEQKERLVIESAKNRETLYKLETNILEVLSQSEGNILEDENAINVLSSSKTMSEEILLKQKANHSLEQRTDSECRQFSPLADYSARLFFCLDRMVHVKPIYHFTLDWFMDIFVENVQKSQKNQRADQCSMHSMKSAFTLFLCRKAFPSFSNEDRPIFTFLISITILRFEVKLK